MRFPRHLAAPLLAGVIGTAASLAPDPATAQQLKSFKDESDYTEPFVRFESGTHGTPIRMSDWRETLNWMLAAGRGW